MWDMIGKTRKVGMIVKKHGQGETDMVKKCGLWYIRQG